MNQRKYDNRNDTICAISTAFGMAAIAMIRLSGPDAITAIEKVFKPVQRNIRLTDQKGYSMFYGDISDNEGLIDTVVIGLFKAPNSYTGEDVVEISCHGSIYIQQRIMNMLTDCGIRVAEPGEFTLRAFLNRRLDLSQAEAVADLIASTSKASHQLALSQMRGGFSKKIEALRQQLLDFASLIELELDFSEEDVEFASRPQLNELLNELRTELQNLVDSFKLGNVLKHGIPVAIIGKTNVGKSTLLNAILNEERAIVSEIPGTTRDTIEDVISIKGIAFRFIDTAGLRDTYDEIEIIGIERTHEKIEQAAIILYIFDLNEFSISELKEDLEDLKNKLGNLDKRIILIGNKTDLLVEIPHDFKELVEYETIFISSKRKENINLIIDSLLLSVEQGITDTDILVSNARHLQALQQALKAIQSVEEGFLIGLSTDLISLDIRIALHQLGEITGKITTDDILSNVFSKFCIGK
ncbi:MAG: tRNA uridine-5-carboxymethylaminomethyl(34) synthesis GTPase MnmE [Bacteroidales bacterium]|jgi:tRNA modification GTPase|nr:tRNA uridine-5-carboxymethylaminomethyl(34) synthesis GTPase MnmE [Bacteroidales bacterium]